MTQKLPSVAELEEAFMAQEMSNPRFYSSGAADYLQEEIRKAKQREAGGKSEDK